MQTLDLPASITTDNSLKHKSKKPRLYVHTHTRTRTLVLSLDNLGNTPEVVTVKIQRTECIFEEETGIH